MRSKGSKVGIYGPSVDHTLGSVFGYYAHVDQGSELGVSKGDKAWLVSDALNTHHSVCFTWFVFLESEFLKLFKLKVKPLQLNKENSNLKSWT